MKFLGEQIHIIKILKEKLNIIFIKQYLVILKYFFLLFSIFLFQKYENHIYLKLNLNFIQPN